MHLEGSLFRGAVASGIAYGMLNSSMSSFYDYGKEYFYWFFGATEFLRPLLLIPTTLIGLCFYLPFDNLKVRYHTMTPLPNGEMPYRGILSTIGQILKYEANVYKYSSALAFMNGGLPAFIKLYITLFTVIYYSLFILGCLFD